MNDTHFTNGNRSIPGKKTIPLKLRLMNGRAKPGEAYVPTEIEHVANMVTHGLWIMPSMVGLLWMMYLSSTLLQLFTATLYGLSLVALFSVSTTFHTICYSGKCRDLKNFFHIGDRAVIYIFIASSYTPWLTLRNFGSWGNQMLWIVWIFAVFGILYQYTFHEKFKSLETLLYIVLGVCPSVVVFEMENTTGLTGMYAGGMIYMMGVIFFKSDGLIPFAHAIWHCFVFVGATFHFCTVCKHLLGDQVSEEIQEAVML